MTGITRLSSTRAMAAVAASRAVAAIGWLVVHGCLGFLRPDVVIHSAIGGSLTIDTESVCATIVCGSVPIVVLAAR